MSVEPQVSECDSVTLSSNVVLKYGDSGSGTSSLDLDTSHPPVKKQPRQWAAWTRQEEESFFNALRQVGKNFEKITNCVQSKNKDQVRHYYYRLVRRMNKLLGPDLCLDAKNSKVTNSAMLRWWSLLEKYSCKPSKLHLKPRRYKLFVETLESQLWRDRRKYIRRRPSLSEHNPTLVPHIVSNHGRPLNQDSHEVREGPADSQKIQKLGTGKGSSIKRDTNTGISRGNRKPDLSAVRTTRQRRKMGVSSTAAYKKWEKAAIAGVSLVADAAEHLERITDKEVEDVHDGHGMERLGGEIPLLTSTSPNPLTEINVQGSVKLKLQLFPINESIRRTLEMDNHNPHLELTLSTRKKISSIMEHLNRKWGNSSVAHGELMLLPYSSPNESLIGCQKWNKDCNLNASDVHALVGSPPVFRLRYGWFTNSELGSVRPQLPILSTPNTVEGCNAYMNTQIKQKIDMLLTSNEPVEDECKKPSELIKDQLLPTTKRASSMVDSRSEMHGCLSIMESSVNVSRHVVNVPSLSFPRTEDDTDTAMRSIESSDDLSAHKHSVSSAGNWADSLTNISVGELLSEASQDGDANCISSPVLLNCRSLQQTSFCSDSFDAAIAAHIYNHQSEAVGQSAPLCHTSSIWDAEETCDEFVFQKTSPVVKNIQGVSKYTSLETSEQISKPISVAAESSVQEGHCHKEFLPDESPQENLVDEPHPDSSLKDLDGLTDIYWPDSLGPLDLDIPSSRYHSEDLILSDSLGGLSRLIASSLDAFQNFSLFGSDNKEPTSLVEAHETAPVTDYKIGTEV